ncbi:MAG TPA: hypothetical protein PLM92_03575 [Bacillota bacterium]|nr:hypothetical protein [Bacillota bacterium]HUM56062.1 hypothetical protein [Bacillota bacterium]
MKKAKQDINGIKWAMAGLIMIAAVNAMLAGFHVYKMIYLVEFAAMLLSLAAWIMIFLASRSLSEVDTEFRNIFFISAICVIVTVFQGLLAAKYYFIDGLGNQAFIDLWVLLMYFITMLGLIFTYRFLLSGCNRLLINVSGGRKTMNWHKVFFRGAILILVCMILMPFALLFPSIVKIILSVMVILLFLAVQGYMCRFIERAYNYIKGKGVTTGNEKRS